MSMLPFSLDPADVAYNRRGELSSAQAAAVRTARNRVKAFLGGLGAVLLAGGAVLIWASLGMRSDPNSGWWAMTAVGGLVGVGGLVLLYFGVRPARPVQIESLTGPVRMARVQRTRTTTTSTGTSTTTYVATELHVSGRIYTLPDEAFVRLQDGATYTVFVREGLDEIYSAERVS